MPKIEHWEIQENTICDGWVNTWTDCETGKPLTFRSCIQAEQELREFLTDTQEAANMGDLVTEYSRDEFRIVRTNTKTDKAA